MTARQYEGTPLAADAPDCAVRNGEHTPGPWMDWRQDHENVISEHRRDDGSFPIIAIVRGANKDANARLIAAAPELLEALKAAKRYLAFQAPDNVWSLVADAIAKTEGRS